MGSRSRKRKARPGAAADPAPSAQERMERGYARGEARNAEIRAGLEPYAPQERPRTLVFAAALCVVLALTNIGLAVGGYDVQGESSLGGALAFAVILLVAAGGMWQKRYWAVLGFQCLLAVTVVIAALSVLVASNVVAVVLCLTIIGLGGWLFWNLVRVLSRLQVPRPGTRDGAR